MSASYLGGKFRAFDDNGTPLATGRLYTYASGTTTQKNAYTDPTFATPCTYTSDGVGGLYIAMNARGEAELWTNGSYTMVLKTALGATVWSADSQGNTASDQVYTSAGTGAISTTVEDELRKTVWLNNYAVNDNATDSAAGYANCLAALGSAGGDIHYDGIFYFASIIVINKNIKLIASGGSGAGTLSSLPTSYFRFSSAITVGPLVQILGHGTQYDGLHVQGGGKGTNANVDNIQILGNSHNVIRCRSWNAGRDGVKVGSGMSSVTICNSGIVNDAICFENGRHGWHMDNNTSPSIPGNNANAWDLSGLHTRNNTGDGTVLDHADLNTLTSNLTEANTGWGRSILNGNFNVVNGGDAEANTAGQFRILGSRNGGDGTNTSNYTQVNIGNYTELTDTDSNRVDCTTINNSKNFNAKGTWTPVLAGTGGTPHASYTIQQGYFWRDGRTLKLTCAIQINGALSGPTGNIEITGFPASFDSTFTNGFLGVEMAQWNGITLSAGHTQLMGRIDANTSKVKFLESGSATAVGFLLATNIGSNAQIYFSVDFPVGAI
jgi:hypothetical protein